MYGVVVLGTLFHYVVAVDNMFALDLLIIVLLVCGKYARHYSTLGICALLEERERERERSSSLTPFAKLLN